MYLYSLFKIPINYNISSFILLNLLLFNKYLLTTYCVPDNLPIALDTHSKNDGTKI